MRNDAFFSKSNLFPAIWAIIIGLLGFIAGLVWNHYSGPDKVLVLNNSEHKVDTSVTIIQFQPDERYFKSINEIASQQIRNQYKANSTPEVEINIDSLAMQIASEYQTKFDSLMLSLSSIQPYINIPDSVNSESYSGTRNLMKLHRPKYKMPSIVEGYINGRFYSIAECSINSLEIEKGEPISIAIDLSDDEYIEKITPLFVDIVSETGPNSYYQIWSEQYEFNGTRNVLLFPAEFKRGKYILSVGTYFIDEVETKYPKFYVKKFNIEII